MHEYLTSFVYVCPQVNRHHDEETESISVMALFHELSCDGLLCVF